MKYQESLERIKRTTLKRTLLFLAPVCAALVVWGIGSRTHGFDRGRQTGATGQSLVSSNKALNIIPVPETNCACVTARWQSVVSRGQSVAGLLDVLRDSSNNVQVRAVAADELGKGRKQEAFDAFCQIVTNKAEKDILRYKAARGLGMLQDEHAVPVLGRILTAQDEDRHLRIVCALALGNLGFDSAVDVLGVAAADSDELIRFKAVQALERTRKDNAVAYVEAASRDRDIYVRARAIHALGVIGGESAAKKITDELRRTKSDFTRIACLTALGESGAPTAIGVLQEFAVSTNSLVRSSAERSLRQLGEKGRVQQ